MICSTNLLHGRAAAAAIVLLLSACGSAEPERSPMERAQDALASGDGVQAEIILRDMLAAGAKRSDLAAFLGEAELQQGQTAEAREWLGKGEFSGDTISHGFHMLARLEMEDGNLPAAGAAFDKALQNDREDAELWVDIARLRYRGGEQRQAIEASEFAVELDPRNPRALILRGQLVRDSEGLVAALPWFEQALASNPDNPELLYDYAATLGEAGRATDMLRVVRHIAEVDPGNRRIYFLQAVLAARAEKWELARSLLLRTSKDVQETPAGILLSGIIDIENGNYASAAQGLEVLAARQPDNRRVQHLFARALSLGGSHSELIYHFETKASEPAASPYLMTLVGRSFEVLDDRAKAAVFLDRAAQPRSGNLIALSADRDRTVAEMRGSGGGVDALQLARARIVAGDVAAAPGAVGPFVEKFPGSSDAQTLAGDAALAARNYPQAIGRYEAAIAIRRPWPITRKLFKAYQAAGRESDAVALLARHFAGDPGNVEAAAALGTVAMEGKDWANAAIFLDHALENGGYRDPYLLSLRSNVALELGDVQTAFEAAETAYLIQPLNRQATNALMRAYAALGQYEAHTKVLEAKLKRLGR